VLPRTESAVGGKKKSLSSTVRARGCPKPRPVNGGAVERKVQDRPQHEHTTKKLQMFQFRILVQPSLFATACNLGAEFVILVQMAIFVQGRCKTDFWCKALLNKGLPDKHGTATVSG
jgi:hypothetical protein